MGEEKGQAMNTRERRFKDKRVSSDWFWEKYNTRFNIVDSMKTPQAFEMLLLMEILKELQYLNDKK